MEIIKPLTHIEHLLENLTPRQLDVFILYGKGRSPDQIAETLFISKKTVWSHKSDIIDEIGFKNSFEFMYHAIKFIYQGDNGK